MSRCGGGGAPQGGCGRAPGHPTAKQWRSANERGKKNGPLADHPQGGTHSTQSCPCGGGGGWRRLVVGWMVETPDFSFPFPYCDMTRRRESTVLGAGIRRTALNLGRASRSWCHRSVVHPFLRRAPARAGSLMSMWMKVGEGSKPFAHSTTSPTSRPPMYLASSSVHGRRGGGGGGGQQVGVGVPG